MINIHPRIEELPQPQSVIDFCQTLGKCKGQYVIVMENKNHYHALAEVQASRTDYVTRKTKEYFNFQAYNAVKTTAVTELDVAIKYITKDLKHVNDLIGFHAEQEMLEKIDKLKGTWEAKDKTGTQGNKVNRVSMDGVMEDLIKAVVDKSDIKSTEDERQRLLRDVQSLMQKTRKIPFSMHQRINSEKAHTFLSEAIEYDFELKKQEYKKKKNDLKK